MGPLRPFPFFGLTTWIYIIDDGLAADPGVVLCVARGIVRIAVGIIRAAARLSGGIDRLIGVTARKCERRDREDDAEPRRRLLVILLFLVGEFDIRSFGGLRRATGFLTAMDGLLVSLRCTFEDMRTLGGGSGVAMRFSVEIGLGFSLSWLGENFPAAYNIYNMLLLITCVPRGAARSLDGRRPSATARSALASNTRSPTTPPRRSNTLLPLSSTTYFGSTVWSERAPDDVSLLRAGLNYKF